MPNKSDELIKQIEDLLEEKGYSYDRKNLAIWLADRKENLENIENNESHQAILIMKQAISTGWDCPRAKILVKLRDNMNEDFETQVIGRIRRMPQAHHYENTLLDNCYLYTFDEKYEQSVKQELGKNAKNAKVIFLKPKYKNYTLKKMSIESDFDGFDDRETFNILYKYYVDKYKLTGSKKNNKSVLEANGYVFKDTIDNYIVKGKFIRLDEIQDAERMKVESAVNPSKNGYEYRDSITEIASRIGIRYDRTKLMLERLFLKSKLFSKKFVDLSLLDFYAFIINNHDTIKHDFEEAVNQKARQMKMKLEGIKESNWRMPQEDYINYDPQMKDTTVYEKNTYKEYPSSRVKSRSESMFEFYCETSDNIKWFYKNGESADNYFSIVYINAVQKKYHFYPDYIICDKNDKIWIIETKGGESATGESKNIDIKVENKFESLKEYSKKHKVNWAFVRDYDKNNCLYYCNTEYTDDMENENWNLIDKMF